MGSPLQSGKQKAINGIRSSRFSECKKIQNCPSEKKFCSPSFWMQGACFTRNFWLKDWRWFSTGIVQPYNHSSNSIWSFHFFLLCTMFFVRLFIVIYVKISSCRLLFNVTETYLCLNFSCRLMMFFKNIYIKVVHKASCYWLMFLKDTVDD